MNITHRIPWDMPYGYTEVTFDHTEEPSDEDYAYAANAAIAMEAAVVSNGGGVKSARSSTGGHLLAAAQTAGAVPYVPSAGGVPEMQGQPVPATNPLPQPYAPPHPPQYAPPSAAQGPEVCPECGAPGAVKNTKAGRKLECTNPNHRDGRYGYTIRWLDAYQGRR